MKEPFEPIFARLKSVLGSYSPPMKAVSDSAKRYDLYTTKEVEMFGRKYPSLYFAGIKLQKGSVGFYYFPLYMYPEMLADIPPELKKLLKGKTCFHIKKYDEEIFRQVEKVMKEGLKCYTKKNFI